MMWAHVGGGAAARVVVALAVLARTGTAQRAVPPVADSVPRPRYTALRSTAPIVVDGALDEAIWREGAPITDFRQAEPEQGKPSRVATRVRIAYDARALYVGIEADDSLGEAGIRVQDLRRKFDYFQNDLVGIVLDPVGDGRNSVSFQVTPYGAQRELEVYDGDRYNREWETVWRVRTRRGPRGWTAEVAIPWSSLRYRAGASTWGLNVIRGARRLYEFSGWNDWPRNLSPYRMDFAGRLEGLVPPPPRADLAWRPYVLGDALRADGGDRTRANVGGEVIWRPTTSLQVEGTVNTDFAQADVDRQVVNLRRFGVFFPERRQFFLENASLFTVHSGESFVVTPFFSRAIGLDAEGNPIAIRGGARAVLRDARTNAGALVIRQAGSGGLGDATIGVARLSRNVGGQSRLGGMVTARHDAGAPGGTDATATADAFVRFSPTTNASWMVSTSRDGATGRQGWAWSGFAGRQTNGLYTGLLSSLATDAYRPSTGFVSRGDVLYTSPAIIGDVRPSWKPSFLRGFKPAILADLYHGPRDGRLQEGYAQAYLDFVFMNGALVYPYVERHWQRPTADLALIPGVGVTAGRYAYRRAGLVARSDRSARLSATLDANTGGFFDGTLDRVTTAVRWVPRPQLAAELSWDASRLRDVGTPGMRVTTHLVAPELRLAWSPRLQLTAFYQYNTSVERGTLNARFSWEYAPLSYVFVVVNDRRRVGGDGGAPVPGVPASQLLVKVVHLFRR